MTLTDAQRAELFQGLGRALSAGLTAAQALGALQGIADGVMDPLLKRAANAVHKGSALTATLGRQELVTDADHVLLAAGEETGNLERVCLRLANRYTRSHLRWSQLKGRLLLPLAVLVIGILVLPLPALAGGRIGVGDYLLQTGAALGMLAMLAWLATSMVRAWRSAGTPGWLTRLARLLPGTRAMSLMHQRADACERVALALA